MLEVEISSAAAVLLGLALLASAVLGYLLWAAPRASAAEPLAPDAGDTGLRRYYLSSIYRTGAEAETVCSPGFHMASLWEISDTSNLEYYSALSYSNDDSGHGPSTALEGWVRTGNAPPTASDIPGEANCLYWQTAAAGSHGTVASLSITGITGRLQWLMFTQECNQEISAWCVED